MGVDREEQSVLPTLAQHYSRTRARLEDEVNACSEAENAAFAAERVGMPGVGDGFREIEARILRHEMLERALLLEMEAATWRMAGLPAGDLADVAAKALVIGHEMEAGTSEAAMTLLRSLATDLATLLPVISGGAPSMPDRLALQHLPAGRAAVPFLDSARWPEGIRTPPLVAER